MQRVAQFEKVTFHQFSHDIKDTFGEKFTSEEIQTFYDNLELPTRATKGSAGYDFHSPIPFALYGWDDVKIPTGIRAKIDEGWFLSLTSRSGLGFKYFLRFANIFPVIDSDFYHSSNEGHIHAKMRAENASSEFAIDAGESFMQGVFLPFGITYDDAADGVRDGGWGSTGK